MEPDVRIKTNEQGFCRRHFDKMFEMKNRLSLALMLESHLKHQHDNVAVCKKSLFGKDNSTKAVENIKKLSSDCYVCKRVEDKYSKMISTAVLLWQKQTDFRKLTSEQPFFCLPHAAQFIEYAKLRMDKKTFAAFIESVDAVQSAYMLSLIHICVGDKVAACTLLFGFSRYDAFPIDVWVKKILAKYYPNGATGHLSGKYAGIAQQYLFYFERCASGVFILSLIHI